MGIRCQKAIT